MYARLRLLASAAAILLVASASGSALEKRAQRYEGGERETWSRGTTPCSVVYYNFCTDWIWAWGNWGPGERLGTTFSACCAGGNNVHQLLAGYVFANTGSPSGYGFTGSLDVWAADAQECPTGAPLHSQPFLPADFWNTLDWTSSPIDVSGGKFVMTYTMSSSPGNPVRFATDHPSAGPGAPQASGLCYPTSRTVHSYWFGTGSSPYCPGAKFPDNPVGDCELLFDVDLMCTTPVAATSWGQIKTLYR